MKSLPSALQIGDDVRFRGVTYRLTALERDVALLAVGGEPPIAIKIGSLLSDETFTVVKAKPLRRRVTGPSKLFESLPAEVKQRAKELEAHITEVLDGVPSNAAPDLTNRELYSVNRFSLRQRELSKHAELVEMGETISIGSLQRLRRAYESEGVLGLVNQRLIRRTPVIGRTDQRVVDAILSVLEQNTQQSSGTMDRLMRQVRKQLETEHGAGEVPFPSRATFHRLVARLGQGRHATGSARTRRTLSQQPNGPFGAVYPIRPGELMQIDSTPLDVAVELDDGVVGRVELTALVDIATRSLAAAVIRPTTKAVNASLLLARCLTPELMRPGWAEAASMVASALPYRTMKSIDDRLAGAAAKPVITPETIVCDHGKAYLSNTSKSACRCLGISFQPAHPETPTDKPVIERRGKNAEDQAGFSLIEIQDLLDEWIVTGWQNGPHEGLRDPFTPSRVLTPNEKYAALLAVSGYVPVPLGPEEYLELMPAETRVINSYCVKIRHRVYDCAELNPYRGQKSGMKAFTSLWEVRYDPYDASCVWVRNHHDGGRITAYWRQLNSSPQPFGDDVWEHGRRIVAGRGTIRPSEESIKEAVDQLLDKASPPARKPRQNRKDRRVTARNAATTKGPRRRPQRPDLPSSPAVEPAQPDTPNNRMLIAPLWRRSFR